VKGLAVRAGSGWPALWTWTKKLAPWALALLVLALLSRHIGSVDWPAVWQALRQQRALDLWLTGALALVSYALFASYDLVGRQQTRHGVGVPRTLGIAAVCYAFNLNFGSLVGALALKLRLYGRAGLKPAVVVQVITLSIVTNWLGYLLLAGLLLLLAPPPMPPRIELSELALRAIGIAMLLVVTAYAVLCLHRRGRPFRWRGRRVAPPRAGVAAWQLAVSSANWLLMGLIVWLLLQQVLPYTAVLAVLLVAAVAGVATHVPAGLGVLEAVFVACLGSELPAATLLAALVTYRAVYYLAPLVLASAGYALDEAAARRTPAAAKSRAPRDFHH
jgi:glycosyltransferase 2 family protein